MPNVMTPNTVSFGGPAALIAPDVAAQQLQLARQQQLIDLLKQRAITPDEQQTVTGSGPSRVVPYNPLQGLSKVLSAYLAGNSQESVDAKNLDLGRQYATRMAQMLSGGGGVDPSVAGPVSMAQGASQQPPQQAQDGSLTNTGGVGPTVQNAQRMDTMTQGPSSQSGGPAAGPAGNNFALSRLLRGSVIEQVGGAPAASAYWKQYEPTDLQRNDTYLGISPDQSRSAELAKRTKEGYIPPTPLRSPQYITPDGQVHFLPPTPPEGFMTQQDPTNPTGYSYQPIGNGTQAVQQSEEARSSGKSTGAAPFDSPVTVPMSDGRSLTLSKPEYAAYQKSGQLPARYSGAQPAAPTSPTVPTSPASATQPAATDRGAIYAAEIAKNQDMLANPAKYMSPADLAQDPDMSQFKARTQQNLAGLQREIAANKIQLPSGGAAPVVGMTPPLGTVPNADASQKASADTMKDSYTRLQSAGTTANSSLDALDKMMALAAKKSAIFTAGPLGTNQSAINPDAAEYEKQRANVIALMAGSGTTDAGRANVGESVPDFGKPKAAIADGLGTLRNQLVAQQLKRTLLTPIYQAGDSKRYTTLENQFDQNVSPNLVPLLTMPSGPKRAEALQAASKDNPAMAARLNWAIENGLLK